MILKVLNSGSKANGYVLTNGNESLIIEAGCSVKEVMKAVNFKMESIKGCFVSHAHVDHSRYIEDYQRHGIKVFMSTGSAFELSNVSEKPVLIREKYRVTVGGFKVIPFNVHHDCGEPLGFVIDHEDFGRLLFATDTSHLTQDFKGLTNIMIEANYSPKIVKMQYRTEEITRSRYDRIINNHMSIDTVLKLLEFWNLDSVRNIMLIHLSDKNSDQNEMINNVIKATGINTIAAEKGIELNLNLF